MQYIRWYESEGLACETRFAVVVLNYLHWFVLLLFFGLRDKIPTT
jgi:hypothetical protein